MKQTLLFLLAICSYFCSGAQGYSLKKTLPLTNGLPAGRTTAGSDTLYMTNFDADDTAVHTYAYTGDSGYVSGTNVMGHYGFAERYTFNGDDTSVTVLGVAAVFVGHVDTASAKTVDIKIWNAAGKTATSRPNLYLSGFPTTTINSVSRSYHELGINDSVATMKEFYFDIPSMSVPDTFFVGYTTNYTSDSLAGDTIAVATTADGSRSAPLYHVTGADTIINVQNATLIPVNIWVDNGTQLGFKTNYWMFPIIQATEIAPSAVITRSELAWYGNYPNPAINFTNIKFGLAESAEVSLELYDLSGRKLKTTTKPMAAGEHTVRLSTADLPSGHYSYLLRTASGSGMVGRITVAK